MNIQDNTKQHLIAQNEYSKYYAITIIERTAILNIAIQTAIIIIKCFC